MTKNLLLSGLAVAALALNSCSSEASDWRPEAKVSLDQVAPGTRSTDNFDQGTVNDPHQAKGGAIAEPISSNVPFEAHKEHHTNAEASISANGEENERTEGKTNKSNLQATPSQEDTTANGHEVQR